ncbi:MAG: hypothetical protein HY286_13590 [Planctomycetes bacterium]|nr:hypothetical protein [Planctomycetota bacterium]
MNYKRRQKLPKPGLQLKLIFTFLGISAFGQLLQFLLFMSTVSSTAVELPHDSGIMMDSLGGLLLKVFATSSMVILPLTLLVGIYQTFKIAGPIHKFERYLESVADGRESQPCRLRTGDSLVELCELINRATQPLRAERTPQSNANPPAALPENSDASRAEETRPLIS